MDDRTILEAASDAQDAWSYNDAGYSGTSLLEAALEGIGLDPEMPVSQLARLVDIAEKAEALTRSRGGPYHYSVDRAGEVYVFVTQEAFEALVAALGSPEGKP